MRKDKYFSKIISLILVLAMLFGLSSQMSAAETDLCSSREQYELYEPEANSISVLKDGSAYVNDCISIYFKDDADEREKAEIISSLGGEILGKFDMLSLYQIGVKKSSFASLGRLCEDLMKNEAVEFAAVSMADNSSEQMIPDDPWDLFWSWEGSMISSDSRWWAKAVEADKAWDYNDYFSKIKVGIVDTGFDTEHEDLKGKISFPTKGMEKQNIPAYHGTHVAGIIGAVPNNGKGIAGLVWNSELICVDWLPDKNSGQSWNTKERILAGLVYAVTAGAKVVNFSLGSSDAIINGTTDRYQIAKDAEAKLSSYVIAKLLQKGYDFLAVQSAGNGITLKNGNFYAVDASNNGTFCCVTPENAVSFVDGVGAQEICDRIVVVGAAMYEDFQFFEMANFSNGGSQVSVYAPGVEIYSTYTDEKDLSIHNAYSYMKGTSVAAPIVTGVASMVWSTNPDMTGAQVKKIICNEKNTPETVRDSRYDYHLPEGEGRLVNARLSVEDAVSRLDNLGCARGKIICKDTENGVAVPYVITDLNSGEVYRGITDKDGNYTKKLPSGEYTVSCNEDGTAYTRQFTVSAGDSTDVSAVTTEKNDSVILKMIDVLKKSFIFIVKKIYELITGIGD